MRKHSRRNLSSFGGGFKAYNWPRINAKYGPPAKELYDLMKYLFSTENLMNHR